MRGELLSERDQERVLELSWALAGTRSPAELAAAALEMTYSLVGVDEVGFSEVDLRKSVHRVTLFPESQASREVLPRFNNFASSRHHPAFAELSLRGRRTPFKMSSIIPTKDFVRTELYESVYQPRGLLYQAVVPIHTEQEKQAGIGYTFNRSSQDFSSSDLHRAYAVQSVLAAHHAALRAQRLSVHGIDAVCCGSRLTERETEIISLVASGMTAEAIGRSLRISPRTVRKHIENSYCKLGVHDRLQAVSYCRQLGLLPQIA
jgi:DNA-binding CsgD family transcriptional regulator